jgi:hypothetical protein
MESQPYASDAASSADPERRQRLKASSLEQTSHQRYTSRQAMPFAHPTTVIMEDHKEAPASGSAQLKIDSLPTDTVKTKLDGKLQDQSRDRDGPPVRSRGPFQQQSNRPTNSRDRPHPEETTSETTGGASSSRVQRPSPSKSRTVSSTMREERSISKPHLHPQPHFRGTMGLRTLPPLPAQQQASRPDTTKESLALNRRRADPSVDLDGRQFRLKLVDQKFQASDAGNAARLRGRGARIGIGIETEFFLRARGRPCPPITNMESFAKLVAKNHNLQVPTHLPRMNNRIAVQEMNDKGDDVEMESRNFAEWSLAFDGTMCTSEEPCKSILFQLIPSTI